MRRRFCIAAAASLMVLAAGLTVLTHQRPSSSATAARTRAPTPTPTTPTTPTPTPSMTPSRTPAPTVFTPPAPGHAVVVGLGDSVPAGSACRCTDFVRLYARELPAADGGPATAHNLGRPGSTSADLLRSLHRRSTIAHPVAGATIVLVTTGANDLGPIRRRHRRSVCGSDCWHDAVAQVGRNIAGIVDAIKHLRAGNSTLVLVTNYWNVFPDGSVARRKFGEAYLRWSDRLTRDDNAAICAGGHRAGARCVDLYAPFKGNGGIDPTKLLAGDGDHPNARGHRLIARTLLAATPADRCSGVLGQ